MYKQGNHISQPQNVVSSFKQISLSTGVSCISDLAINFTIFTIYFGMLLCETQDLCKITKCMDR